MPTLIFSATAIHDLERLRTFLSARNTKAAREAVRKVIAALKSLEVHPELGRLVEDRAAEYRELVIPFGRNGYIAAYRCTEDVVLVLGLWHQREKRD